MNIDYQGMSAHILDYMLAAFPVAHSRYPDQQSKARAAQVLAGALERRRITQHQAERILFWMEEFNSQWPPSIGQMVAWSKIKTGKEYDTEYASDRLRIAHSPDSDTITPASKENGEKAIKSILQGLTTND